MLAGVFRRIEDPDLRYELGLFLGEHSVGLEDAVSYYQEAAKARPAGRRALRGLVNAYRQLGDDGSAAAATERLLDLFEPSEPSAMDLRMGIANFLSNKSETLPRALEHGRIVLQARPDDARAIQLMADLLERAGRPVEAVQLLDRLIARERNRDRLHDIYLRKARLLADREHQQEDALEALERAAAISPGNRDTITLLVEQLGKAGQTKRVGTYLAPIRSTLVGNISRGAVSVRELTLLAKVAEQQHPALAETATALLRALEPGDRAKLAVIAPAKATGLRRALETASIRTALYAQGEPPQLHSLLQAVDPMVARLPREFPGVGTSDAGPLPREVEDSALTETARELADVVGVRLPRLAASSGHNTVLLVQDPICSIRLGQNLWSQGDLESWRGLLAVAAARSALETPRARALSPPDMDLLISACFEVVDVFNPTTADPDPRRLRDLVTNLRNVVPRRGRKSIEAACQVLASHAFDAGATSRSITSTDLHFAALISGDLGGTLGAACLLDGVVGGTLKQRIGRSKLARELMAHLVSDEFLEAHEVATNG
jgi:tetratricopeptide (TPR) repeat protein